MTLTLNRNDLKINRNDLKMTMYGYITVVFERVPVVFVTHNNMSSVHYAHHCFVNRGLLHIDMLIGDVVLILM